MSRSRFFWILLAAAALAYITCGLSRISFNVDILRLLPSHLRQVEGLSLFLKHFAQPDELIVTIDAPDSETAEAAADKLAAALREHATLVKSATARPPWENDPASLSEFLTFLLLNQPADKMDGIRRKLAPDQAGNTLRETLDTLRTSVSPRDLALLSYDPFGLSSALSGSGVLGGAQQSEFSSDDGKFRVVYVAAAHPFANYKQTAGWLTQIRAICSGAVAGTPVRLGFTGEPAFVAEISTGMEWDMITSAFATLALISLIFWLCYGRIAPLRWLMGMLLLTFVLSLATAGLFLNQITVIGAGFASVMIGLSVDYGYLIYQQSLRTTGTVRHLQWQCLQNIAWTASTTAAAFFALNLSSLPGLSQLGSMVGLGVCVGALVMLGVFAPLSMRLRPASGIPTPSRLDPLLTAPRFAVLGERLALGMVVLLLGGLFLKGFPEADFSAATFRARQSGAQTALENLYSRLTDDRGLLSLIITGKNEAEVLARLQRGQARMDDAIRQGMAKQFFSPLPLWPDGGRQRDNLAVLASLSGELPRLKKNPVRERVHRGCLRAHSRGIRASFCLAAPRAPGLAGERNQPVDSPTPGPPPRWEFPRDRHGRAGSRTRNRTGRFFSGRRHFPRQLGRAGRGTEAHNAQRNSAGFPRPFARDPADPVHRPARLACRCAFCSDDRHRARVSGGSHVPARHEVGFFQPRRRAAPPRDRHRLQHPASSRAEA